MEEGLSIYNRSLEVLFERFPHLGLLAGSWTKIDVEEETLPTLKLENAEVLYFFGLGTGSIYRKCKRWLEQDVSHKLIFLEDNPGVIATFLFRKEAAQILSDPQVYLELFSHLDEEIDQMAKRFAVKRLEVAGLRSKSKLEDLRLKLLRKTTLSSSLRFDRMHGYQPFQNFCRNLVHLPLSFYANRLRGAFQKVPAIVCGAGPSLEETIDCLKKLENRALIIAGGSALAALSSRGIIPHFGVAIDPNLEEYRRLRNSFCFEMPLIYTTRVHPDIFQTCSGPFGYMRSGIGGAMELWLEEELGLQDPLLGKNLSDETISVTGISLAIALDFGCDPILINGVDLAYTQKRRYARGVVFGETTDMDEIDKEQTAADQILVRKDRLNQPVYTAVRWVMESASISHFAAKHRGEVNFINTTSGGIGFEGIDYVSIEEASANFQDGNIRKRVFEMVQSASMPKETQKIIVEKMDELKASLKRLIHFLEILAGERKGSKALAELDLKEEIATLYLFYDVSQFLSSGDDFWEQWLKLARKYDEVFFFAKK